MVEDKEIADDRRANRFKFDKTLNLGTLLTATLILYGMYSGFSSIKSEFTLMARQNGIMWQRFVKANQLTNEEIRELNR